MQPSAGSAGPFEDRVLAALNVARADPRSTAGALSAYRRFYHGRMVRVPGDPVSLRTREGTPPVDEAIGFLLHQPELRPLAASGLLADAARDHVRAQSASGATGHFEGDGFGPEQRSRAHGGGGQLGEVIAYGPRTPEDVIRQLIIDDGVSDRGHRRILFDADLAFAGVACGPHPVFRTMCVVDLARTWNGGGGTVARDWVAARAADFARSMRKLLPAQAR